MCLNSMVPCAVVIATLHRPLTLERAIKCLAAQDVRPAQVIVADGAEDRKLEPIVRNLAAELSLPLRYHLCKQRGAAAQRNEAAQLVSEDVILFMDDDVYMEPGCLKAMMKVLTDDEKTEIGGVGVILTNQHYTPPRKLFKLWLSFLAGERADSYAGRVIGPAVNILPASLTDGRVVEVEWLNSTCTAYRREAFLAERFGEQFEGYSMFEDVHLSLRIGRRWKLVVATGARAFHDTQPSPFKRPFRKAKMEVENRYLVMTDVMGRRDFGHYLKFALLIPFSFVCNVRSVRSLQGFKGLFFNTLGHVAGLLNLIWHRGYPRRRLD